MSKQYLTLVVDVKINDEGEQVLETKDYILPVFIKGGTVKQALKLAQEINGLSEVLTDENGKPILDKEGNVMVEEKAPEPILIDKLAQFAVEAFGKQFKKDEVIDGLDSRDLIEQLTGIIGMVMSREQDKAKKKEFIEAKTR